MCIERDTCIYGWTTLTHQLIRIKWMAKTIGPPHLIPQSPLFWEHFATTPGASILLHFTPHTELFLLP